jgi:hypothetical protein
MNAIMIVSRREDPDTLAGEDGRSPEYKHGYIHGERSRKLKEVPPRYLILGIDDYAFGFRAGYFANVRTAPRPGGIGR